jgi:signal transduction histidine kinase
MTPPDNPSLQICGDRMAEMLAVLERMAAGDTSLRLTISDRRDELDALAHGINVLVGELGWATAQAVDAHKERASLAEQANASKNIFFRNMSHEIRTRITTGRNCCAASRQTLRRFSRSLTTCSIWPSSMPTGLSSIPSRCRCWNWCMTSSRRWKWKAAGKASTCVSKPHTERLAPFAQIAIGSGRS